MTGGRAKLFIHGTRRSEGTVCMTDRLQSHARAVRKQHSDMGATVGFWNCESQRATAGVTQVVIWNRSAAQPDLIQTR